TEPPTITIDPEMKDGIAIRAGDTIVISASKIVGKPPPTAAWSKGGRELKTSDIVTITSTPTSSTLAIKYASRKNTGEYTITAIEGYIVEYKKEGHDDWETETQYPLKASEYVIGKLQKGGKYHFRVSAVNSEGIGEPAEVEKVTELVDQEMLPDFELDAELRRTLVVRVRASIRMFVPIKGRPVPEVTWSKDDANLKTRAHIDNTESYTLLVIPDCTRYDAGKYHLSLENVAGKKTGFAPSAPENLYVTDVTSDSASLAWTKPLHDGGSLITGYVIEAQKKDTDQWVHVATIKALDYTVTDLIEGAEYTFRIMAVNASGRSDPRESRPAVIKEQTSAPSFDLRGVYQKTIIAKAGDRLKVEIPVLGKPRPVVSWKKGDTVLKETQRLNIETTPTSTILNISEIKKKDGGQYSMTGKNMLGCVLSTRLEQGTTLNLLSSIKPMTQ
uniref:Titin n=1 Tax=Pundamilia nyererei TaxID=303518 RepID=A0A3B4GDG9_9CICH